MYIKMVVIEPTKEKALCSSKMTTYKNNIEVFKQVDICKKQKTTTLMYYVGVDADVTKLLK